MFKLTILLILLAYFGILFYISRVTSRKATNDTYFRSGKSAPWALVAFGMIGTSLSGVTFISVPGTVGTEFFYYFQVVIGYLIGYFVVAYVLLPLYYRLNLTSIYSYLQDRFGMISYKSGALLFIVSRTLGATLRLYLVINVLQTFVLDGLGINFYVTTLIILAMILLYTFKGGVKTIVWTDTLQTLFMLFALVICVGYILSDLNLGMAEAWNQMGQAGYTQIFNTDYLSSSFMLKHILGGAVITISMTGLDQEMMQKNISVKNLGDSQKNMITFSMVMVLVNFIFLILGGLLYLYANSKGIHVAKDELFPTVAMNHMPQFISVIFIIGLISALFPSADGAITALTASFCIDIIGINRNEKLSDEERVQKRKQVHLVFAAVFLVMVIYFKWLDNKQIITILLTIASYTYGPLLGLFAFGILTKRKINDRFTPFICVLAPALAFMLDYAMKHYGCPYKIGFEMLLINGVLAFCGLWMVSRPIDSSNRIPLPFRQ